MLDIISNMRLSNRIKHFLQCQRGNVAMLFGLSLIPMAAAAGTGIDLARAMVVRTQVADALDAAGLAIGTTNGMTNAQVTALARQYFQANYKADPSFGTPAPISVTQSGQDFILSTNMTVPTTLLQIVGVRELPLEVDITITRSSIDLEVAIALDTTGSM